MEKEGGEKFTTALCDLCENMTDVTSKCRECNQVMCTSCKVIHSRSKGTRDHNVELVTMESNQISESSTDDERLCNIHKTNLCQLFCKDCKQYVCLDCVTDVHQGHHFAKISIITQKKQGEIFKLLEDFEMKNRTALKTALDRLLIGRKNFHSKTCDAEREIISRTKHLHIEIDKIGHCHIEKIYRGIEENDEKISSNINAICERIHNLDKFVSSWKDRLKYASCEFCVKLVSECESEIMNYSTEVPKLPSIMIPKFVVNCTNKDNVERVFGSVIYENSFKNLDQSQTMKQEEVEQKLDQSTQVKDEPAGSEINAQASDKPNVFNITASRYPPQNIKVRVISSLKCSSYDGPTLSAIDEKTALIGSDVDTFSLIGQDGHVVNSVNPQFRIRHAVILPTGDFLIACGLKSKLVKLHKDGKIEVFYNTKPNNPYRLCVTDNGHILACLTAYMDDSQVIRLSMTGEKLQTYISSDDGSPLFEDPGFLLENINGDVWVQDQGYVLAIQNDGNSCFKYCGPPGVKTQNPFKPAGLDHDKFGHIVIADNANSTIHLVDMEGRFIQHLMTKKDKLLNPYALSIDSIGKLWIGCEKGSNKNIFIVKYLPDKV